MHTFYMILVWNESTDCDDVLISAFRLEPLDFCTTPKKIQDKIEPLTPCGGHSTQESRTVTATVISNS